ncbi:class I SAM-dependent methyltransferase [Streptomyces boninensis]|uniref:class I SAM-dependent methyltransferase n=1 Tax=Streptomyces boninensis TaxID=2039455 RepID=UPI003B21C61C
MRRHEYVFSTESDLGLRQVRTLELLLDGATEEILAPIGPSPGARCLEAGAGGGSIARLLAERAGPHGEVVAVDTDTKWLDGLPGVQVHTHDINEGLPVAGPYDLIHARLLLMHLGRRREILRMLVDALAPGGWLVTGDFGDRSRQVLAAPSAADAELFERVQDIGQRHVLPLVGMDMGWAAEADGEMAAAGLVDLDGLAYRPTAAGGSPGALLHHNHTLQMEPLLLKAGITTEELTRYRALMADPRFRAWFFEFVCHRGRKPAA